MKLDALTRYTHALNSLRKEKADLESRLADINRVLTNGEVARVEAALAPKRRRVVTRKGKRSKNPMSLKAAILKVTAAKLLTKQEILQEVQKLGYKFGTDTPMRNLDAILYAKNPKFERKGGKFGAPK